MQTQIKITPNDILDAMKNGEEESFRASIKQCIDRQLGQLGTRITFTEEIKRKLNELYDILSPLMRQQKQELLLDRNHGRITDYLFSAKDKCDLLENGLIRQIKDKILSVLYGIAKWCNESWLGKNFAPFQDECQAVQNWTRYGAARQEMQKIIPQIEDGYRK